jgi:hypothetical protein
VTTFGTGARDKIFALCEPKCARAQQHRGNFRSSPRQKSPRVTTFGTCARDKIFTLCGPKCARATTSWELSLFSPPKIATSDNFWDWCARQNFRTLRTQMRARATTLWELSPRQKSPLVTFFETCACDKNQRIWYFPPNLPHIISAYARNICALQPHT